MGKLLMESKNLRVPDGFFAMGFSPWFFQWQTASGVYWYTACLCSSGHLDMENQLVNRRTTWDKLIFLGKL
jgi:hypothetical protein